MYEFNDVRENENKGFSLVELIVVIAIMAVMVAVLAPSLLQYVEKSRAQKDDSAMGEVTNAIMLAMSSQEVYDEVLYYAAKGNASCYVDKAGEIDEEFKVKVDDNTFYYNDEARLADEVDYWASGAQRGVTITFVPEYSSNVSTYDMGSAIINKFIRPADTLTDSGVAVKAGNGFTAASNTGYINANPTYATLGTLKTMGTSDKKQGQLYGYVRAAIGDTVELSSQTYRNSEYTVFIRMGSTGGNNAAAQTGIQVYGQWNGTNLVNQTPAGA